MTGTTQNAYMVVTLKDSDTNGVKLDGIRGDSRRLSPSYGCSVAIPAFARAHLPLMKFP